MNWLWPELELGSWGALALAVAGLVTAPGFLASFPFLAGSFRRRSRWWMMSPARAERRVDPRCGERQWARTGAYAAALALPGLILGALLSWTVIGLGIAALSVWVVAIAVGVRRDSPRVESVACLPAAYAATAFAAITWAVVDLGLTHGFTPGLVATIGYLAPWLVASVLAGWQLLIAARAQQGARRIARDALRASREWELV